MSELDIKRIELESNQWVISQGNNSTIGLNAHPANLGYKAGAFTEFELSQSRESVLKEEISNLKKQVDLWEEKSLNDDEKISKLEEEIDRVEVSLNEEMKSYQESNEALVKEVERLSERIENQIKADESLLNSKDSKIQELEQHNKELKGHDVGRDGVKIVQVGNWVNEEEKLAVWLHETYEALAIKNKWNTQQITKVKFEDLPIENRNTMLDMAKEISSRESPLKEEVEKWRIRFEGMNSAYEIKIHELEQQNRELREALRVMSAIAYHLQDSMQLFGKLSAVVPPDIEAKIKLAGEKSERLAKEAVMFDFEKLLKQ